MIDLLRILQAHGAPVLYSGHHHCHEGWVQTHCPRCTDGRYGWHLGISMVHGNVNCWRCGALSLYEIAGELARIHKIPMAALREFQWNRSRPTEAKEITRPKSVTPPPGARPLTAKEFPAHVKYLRRRGFAFRRLVEEWGLLGTDHLTAPGWKMRVVAPVRDRDGRVVAYAGRSISSRTTPKWRMTTNAEMAADPRTLLYGIEKVVRAVLVVEGPSDVWRMGPGAVATMGIDWKVEQADILRRISRRFIMYDPERKAQQKAQQLAVWLCAFPGETELIDGLKCDPGDLSHAQSDNMMQEIELR